MFILGILNSKIFLGVALSVILITFLCIIYLVVKERKADKEEIEEIVEDLRAAKPRTVEPVKVEAIKAEPVKQIEETVEPVKEGTIEIAKVLEEMQKNLDTNPEEAVETFEKEQEEKAIISYQELVKSLKKTEPIESEMKTQLTKNFDDEIIDIDDSVEVKQVEAVPGFEKEKEEIKKPSYGENKKFKQTEFISPIYGKMGESKSDYPTVPNFKETQQLGIEDFLEDKKEMSRTAKLNSKLIESNIAELDDEVRKNDDFLKSLKDFRSNLE